MTAPVTAAEEPTFDPVRCQWCNETGFDLRGLAHHVWMRCEMVERLAQENIEDCRRSHEEFHAQILANRAADAIERLDHHPKEPK